ncbi:MAG: HD domain-containing phosphohydrolase [Chlorobiaceae bacterium]
MAKKQKSINSQTSKELRAQAEARLKHRHLSACTSASGPLSSPEEMLKHVHELEVNQVELEVELEDALSMNIESYDFAPAGYLTLGRDGRILQANMASSRLLGVDCSRLVAMHFKEFVVPGDRQAVDNLLEAVFTKRADENCEVTLLAEAAQLSFSRPILCCRTLRINARLSDTGNTCQAIVFDITELKLKEEELVKRQAIFNQALEAAHAGIWEWDLKTNELYWSNEVWELSGLKNNGEKPSFKLWEDSVHPDDRALVIHALTAAVKMDAELNFEYRHCYPDGSVRWNMSRGKPLYSEQGEVDRYIGTVIDITERKYSEEALKKEKERFSSLFDNMLNGIAYCRVIFEDNLAVDFVYEQVNPSFEKLTGLREVQGKRVSDVIPDIHQMQPELLEIYARVAATGSSERFQFQFLPLMIWLEISVYSVQKGHFVAVFDNITERKAKEQLIAEGRAKLEAALASMNDAVFISDSEGRFIHFNDAFVRFHRFRSKKECARTLGEYPQLIDLYLITGELVPLENWVVSRALRGETGTGVEFRLLRRDSGETWFGSYNYAPIFDKEAHIVGSVVTARDISVRKAEEEMIKNYVKQLENSMPATLQALASVVEAHDPYTAGHERRVGIIAADIAGEMGWSKEKCDNLQLIGLVHDIGKMSIPTEILSKPSQLSTIEFELVKTHAEEGYKILKDIEFPLPIAEIVREHHERMDGSGYPQGLKGAETLLEARILAVADMLEAMASHRPYRSALGIDAAIKEIESQSCSLLDKDVVDAMLRLFRQKGYQLPN